MKIFTFIIASIFIIASCKKDKSLAPLVTPTADCVQNAEPAPPYFEYDNKFEYSVKSPVSWIVSEQFSFFAHDSGKSNNQYCSGYASVSINDNGSLNKGIGIYIQKADPRCNYYSDSLMVRNTFDIPESNESLTTIKLNLDSILFYRTDNSTAKIELQILGWSMTVAFPDILINTDRNNIQIEIDLSNSEPIFSFYVNEILNSTADIFIEKTTNEENYLMFESKLIISDPNKNSICNLKVPEIHLELWNKKK